MEAVQTRTSGGVYPEICEKCVFGCEGRDIIVNELLQPNTG